MAIINVTTQAQRDYLENHIEVAEKLARYSDEAATLQARATARAAERDAVGDRVRAGLVDKVPALDGTLEAQLTNIQIVRDGEGVITEVRTNGDAA